MGTVEVELVGSLSSHVLERTIPRHFYKVTWNQQEASSFQMFQKLIPENLPALQEMDMGKPSAPQE